MYMYSEIEKISNYYQKIIVVSFLQKNAKKINLIKIESILVTRH